MDILKIETMKAAHSPKIGQSRNQSERAGGDAFRELLDRAGQNADRADRADRAEAAPERETPKSDGPRKYKLPERLRSKDTRTERKEEQAERLQAQNTPSDAQEAAPLDGGEGPGEGEGEGVFHPAGGVTELNPLRPEGSAPVAVMPHSASANGLGPGVFIPAPGVKFAEGWEKTAPVPPGTSSVQGNSAAGGATGAPAVSNGPAHKRTAPGGNTTAPDGAPNVDLFDVKKLPNSATTPLPEVTVPGATVPGVAALSGRVSLENFDRVILSAQSAQAGQTAPDGEAAAQHAAKLGEGAAESGAWLDLQAKVSQAYGQTAPEAASMPLPAQAVETLRQGLEGMQRSGRNTLKLQLRPENLGEVNLVLTTQGGATSVRIEAEQGSTGMLLQQNLNDLRQALSQAGVQVKEVVVSADTLAGQQLTGGGFGQPAGQQQPGSSHSGSNRPGGSRPGRGLSERDEPAVIGEVNRTRGAPGEAGINVRV